MKCPWCVEEGKTSKLYVPMSGISTAMGYESYYDEQGKFHRHDPNSFTQELSCSEGHRWVSSQRGGCPSCGTEPEVTTRRLDDARSGGQE